MRKVYAVCLATGDCDQSIFASADDDLGPGFLDWLGKVFAVFELPEFSLEVGCVFGEEFFEDRQRFLKLVHALLG